MLIEVGKDIIEKQGYSFTGCLDSEEALKLFESDPFAFDLVISDITMPHLTGDVLSGKIKEIRSDIPIILCSGFNERVTKETVGSIGAEDFLIKPITRKTLSEKFGLFLI